MGERLPDFVVIGAAKAGTTTLYHYLREHPSIFMPATKEPCFFDEAANWHKGVQWYASLFSQARQDQICGEASTNYTRWPQVKRVPKLMHSLIPKAKLVYLLREPVARSYSHFIHRRSKELAPTRPFTVEFLEHISQDPMCIDSSRYYEQILQYLEYFPIEQIYLVRFEDLVGRPTKTLSEIFQFLDLPRLPDLGEQRIAANDSLAFIELQKRAATTGPLKKVPILGSVIPRLLPTAAKTSIYNWLSKVGFGSSIKRNFAPPPLSMLDAESVRKLLATSTSSLEREFGITWETQNRL